MTNLRQTYSHHPLLQEWGTLWAAALIACAALFIGMAPIPSTASMATTCSSSGPGRCCACYYYDDGIFHCHDRAKVGASYCDSSTEYCSRSSCRANTGVE